MNDLGLPGGVNPLDFLHKLSTQRGLPRPEFEQIGEQGLPHNKVFLWQCSFNNLIAQGTGKSKKEAKVAAARAVRDQLNFEDLPPAPTFQSVMERKKRKHEFDQCMDEADPNGKMRKYDYGRHFQCYGGAGGPQGAQPPFVMDVPYGYLPDRPYPSAGGMPMEGDPCEGLAFDSPDFSEYALSDPASPVNKGFMSRLSKLDRYVIKRHTQIYPSEDHLAAVLKLVTDVETAMKDVSDKWNENAENTNKIEGLVRVGDLAKGLLLAPDRSVSLVLLCASAPNTSMLQELHASMKAKLAELKEEHDTLLLEKEAAFAISKLLASVSEGSTSENMFCYITLTSMSMRKNLPEDDKETTEEGVKADEVDENCLPADKCLLALAELRHSRWFVARAANLPSCVECIRIMRDLSRRDTAWSCLTDWAIELLVERALYSAWRPLNPAASLMRVMEVIASGLLFDPLQGFKDPCERTDVSPFANVSKQEAEEVTKSAQGYLRLMHFRQIYKVLGMQVEADDTKEDEKEPEPEGN